jgi:hypothetical protein
MCNFQPVFHNIRAHISLIAKSITEKNMKRTRGENNQSLDNAKNIKKRFQIQGRSENFCMTIQRIKN